MADLKYGYVEGQQILVRFPVDSSTSAIAMGDMISFGTAGYVKQAAANDTILGFAAEVLATAPSNDGDVSILVDVSTTAIYRFPPDEGTVTAALAMLTCDCGGPRSVNIDASTDDCILIVRCDVAANELYIQRRHALAGVV